MAKLKLGDAIPEDCTEVDHLAIAMLSGTGGTLARIAGSGVTAQGKLLRASRRSDYITAFDAVDLGVCEEFHTFCMSNQPLFLALEESGAPPASFLWLCAVLNFGRIWLGHQFNPGGLPNNGDMITLTGVPVLGGFDVNGTWTLSGKTPQTAPKTLCGTGGLTATSISQYVFGGSTDPGDSYFAVEENGCDFNAINIV